VARHGRDDTQPHRQRYRCTACLTRFDDRTGTALAGHHRPLRVWVLGLYLMGLDLSHRPIAQELGLSGSVDWHDYEDLMHTLLQRQYRHAAFAIEVHPSQSSAVRALGAYFAGDVKAIEGLSVVMGGIEFQRRVWAALRDIPAGETISYGVLAARIGRPTAVRAVGHANGANLIDIVVPCHRVVGANRSLSGYGGGLERKCWLLDHERKWQGGSA
jgi:methylated-DNA-[protein]-cysteine S-methyltransferase